MAARLWRLLVGCGAAIGATLAAVLWYLFPVSVRAALAAGLALALCAPAALVAASFPAAVVLGRRRLSVADVGYLLAALLTEMVDFNLAVLAMMASIRSKGSKIGPQGCAANRPVLLIHGIVCNHGVWNGWPARLEASGFGPVRAMDLEPPLADIDSHATLVARELRVLFEAGGGNPVHIIAHSMGGLVARAALRRVGPAIIGRIVTIATPHHGTQLARLFRRRRLLQQMCPESAWLNQLNLEQATGAGVPITSIYSLEDNIIVPAESAVLPHACSVELRGIGHVGVLSSRKALDTALAALNGGRPS